MNKINLQQPEPSYRYQRRVVNISSVNEGDFVQHENQGNNLNHPIFIKKSEKGDRIFLMITHCHNHQALKHDAFGARRI